MARKKIVAGNWKMNMTPRRARAMRAASLVEGTKRLLKEIINK